MPSASKPALTFRAARAEATFQASSATYNTGDAKLSLLDVVQHQARVAFVILEEHRGLNIRFVSALASRHSRTLTLQKALAKQGAARTI